MELSQTDTTKVKKEITVLAKIIRVLVVFLLVISFLLNGVGGWLVLFGLSFVLGIIQYLIFRNKIKNPKIVIFGITFVLSTMLVLLGKLTNLAGGVTSNNIEIAKPVWIKSCVKSATSGNDEKEKQRYCECLFASLVEKYTWEKLSVMKSSPELSSSIKNFGYKCMEKEGYLFGDKLKDTYKKSYVESCTQTGASDTNCNCYFDLLIEKLGVNGFAEMGKVLDEKPVSSPEVKKYLDLIQEQKNKCGQLN